MENFFSDIQKVSLACTGAIQLTQEKPSYDAQGKNHGTFCFRHQKGLKKTVTFFHGVLDGPWEISTTKYRVMGNFVDGKPEGKFVFDKREKGEIVPDQGTSFVEYKNGEAFSHTHNASWECPLGCVWEKKDISWREHSLSWLVQGRNLEIVGKIAGRDSNTIKKYIRQRSECEGKTYGWSLSPRTCNFWCANDDLLPKGKTVHYYDNRWSEEAAVFP